MTEPDEALLWARERAARWQDEGGGEAGPAYRRGDLDFFLGDEVEGYRAGSAASAARIKELEAALQRLVNASEPVEEYTHEVAIELEEAIKTAKSVLKEPCND